MFLAETLTLKWRHCSGIPRTLAKSKWKRTTSRPSSVATHSKLMIRKFSPKAIRWLDYKYSLLVHVKPPSQLTIKPHLINPYFSEIWYSTPGGGHLGIFWVGMCRPGLQIATPFENNFPYNWYPFLEMGQFFIPRSRIRPKTDTPFWKWANFLYSVPKFVKWNSPVFLKRYFFICSIYTPNKCFFIISNNF